MPTWSPLSCALFGRSRPAPARRQTAGRIALASTAGLAGLSLLAGCAVSRVEPVSGVSSSAAHITGHTFGGQQPVSGSTIQLYAAGTTGNASAATPLLTTQVLTDANGAFDITGDYTCPSATTQVYLTATGGNPGLPGNGGNGALSMMVVLGDCGSLATTQSVQMNELTTVAAAWALAPFASSTSRIGASSTNLAGLRGAMRNAQMLADSYSGTVPSTSLPANATVEAAKIVALGDILAGCVNSNGSGPCTTLFQHATPAGGSAPADTFTATLAVVQNPGNNVTQVFNDMPAQTAFPGALSTAPSDWTLSVAYTGGGLRVPSGITIDDRSNIWVSNLYGSVSAFSQQGEARFPSGISGSGLNLSGALTVDPSQNVWVSNQATSGISGPGSITTLTSAGAITSGNSGLTSGNVNAPSTIAADSNGAVWVANSGSNSVTLFNAAGVPQSGAQGFGTGLLSSPSALALDSFHNVWVANYGSGTLVQFDSNGSALRNVSCCGSPNALALDGGSNLWITDRNNNQVTVVSSSGLVLFSSVTGGGINGPSAIAVDTADHVFVINQDGSTFSEFAGTNASLPAGTALSPAAGFGLDSGLRQPLGAAVDTSGTLWVTSSANHTLMSFFGLATPVQTPRYSVPQLP